MNRKLKILVVIPLIIISLIMLVVVGYIVYGIAFRTHPGPVFSIGNNFDQPVIVYFEGKIMGKISQGESKKFYPNEVVPSPFTREIRITSNPNSTQVQNEIVTGDLLVELKSNSGTVLYSRYFTWDELVASLEGGKITWIGEGK